MTNSGLLHFHLVVCWWCCWDRQHHWCGQNSSPPPPHPASDEEVATELTLTGMSDAWIEFWEKSAKWCMKGKGCCLFLGGWLYYTLLEVDNVNTTCWAKIHSPDALYFPPTPMNTFYLVYSCAGEKTLAKLCSIGNPLWGLINSSFNAKIAKYLPIKNFKMVEIANFLHSIVLIT